jgi:hypothetical protein
MDVTTAELSRKRWKCTGEERKDVAQRKDRLAATASNIVMSPDVYDLLVHDQPLVNQRSPRHITVPPPVVDASDHTRTTSKGRGMRSYTGSRRRAEASPRMHERADGEGGTEARGSGMDPPIEGEATRDSHCRMGRRM